jgi:hypothetical protein
MKNAIVCLTLILITLLAGGGPSAGMTTTHFGTDNELLQYLSDTLFVCEGRIGDRGGAATFELDLGHSTSAPDQTADYDWQNGVPEPFTLSYDPMNSLVTFTLGGITLLYTTSYEDFDAIFVRTRAVNEGTSVTVEDLVYNGENVDDLSSTTGDGLDILLIYGLPIADGFTLAGIATLSWTGTPPTQSRLAFQIKVARSTVIDAEETSWGAMKSVTDR